MALPWQPTDARLLARIRAGDEKAFEQVYERYSATILAFCRQLTGQREDAEDALQHTFLAAYRQIVGSGGPLELRPWLFTVARNRCLTQLRSRADRALSFDVPNPDAAGLSEEVERREELRQLVTDLRSLPEPQRAALLLSQLDAMPYGEIGQVLGVPPEKVKALVFQARSSLASTREAREAPCVDIRQQLATARGASLRRRSLRRHVHVCTGCREYETIVRRQRRALDQLLPVPPSAALTGSVLGAIGREGGAGVGGAATVASGGTAGGSLAGMLSALGGPGIAKMAVVAAVVGGGGTGAVAADLPERIAGGERAPAPVAPPRPDGETAPLGSDGGTPEADGGVRQRAGAKGGGGGHKQTGPLQEPASGAPDDVSSPGDSAPDAPSDPEDDGAGDTPPGLDEHGGVPPGQAKKGEGWVPPGQAKKQGEAPSGKAKGDANGGGNGQGNGGGNSQGNGGNGGGQGQGNGGGSGNGQGNGGGQSNGNGGSNGQGSGANGGANGQGNGANGGGQGQGNGGGSGQGNGGDNGNGGS